MKANIYKIISKIFPYIIIVLFTLNLEFGLCYLINNYNGVQYVKNFYLDILAPISNDTHYKDVGESMTFFNQISQVKDIKSYSDFLDVFHINFLFTFFLLGFVIIKYYRKLINLSSILVFFTINALLLTSLFNWQTAFNTSDIKSRTMKNDSTMIIRCEYNEVCKKSLDQILLNTSKYSNKKNVNRNMSRIASFNYQKSIEVVRELLRTNYKRGDLNLTESQIQRFNINKNGELNESK